MEMFFLIGHIGYGSVIIPDKYTKDECHKLAIDLKSFSAEYYCIPAPKLNVCEYIYSSMPFANGSGAMPIKVCKDQ